MYNENNDIQNKKIKQYIKSKHFALKHCFGFLQKS